jgi:hypothetical protein
MKVKVKIAIDAERAKALAEYASAPRPNATEADLQVTAFLLEISRAYREASNPHLVKLKEFSL